MSGLTVIVSSTWQHCLAASCATRLQNHLVLLHHVYVGVSVWVSTTYSRSIKLHPVLLSSVNEEDQHMGWPPL